LLGKNIRRCVENLYCLIFLETRISGLFEIAIKPCRKFSRGEAAHFSVSSKSKSQTPCHGTRYVDARASNTKAHLDRMKSRRHVSTILASRVMLLVGLSLRVRESEGVVRYMYLMECYTGAFFGGKISAAGRLLHARVRCKPF
jgi:hypothetical protein